MDLSVVIPVFNSADRLPRLGKSLVAVLSAMPLTFEVILVDDGSTDNSKNMISNLNDYDNRIIGFSLKKNRGQHIAVLHGIRQVAGNCILVMDDDMVSAVGSLPEFWHKMVEGYDVVSGYRENRLKSGYARGLIAQAANLAIRFIASRNFNDATSPFKLFEKKLVEEILANGVFNLLVPEYLMMKGNQICELPLPGDNRPKSLQPRSRYTLRKLLIHTLRLCSTMAYILFGGRALKLRTGPQTSLAPDEYLIIGRRAVSS
jgi:glycosyltransferase involved in cell wall biosynthesis